MDTKLALNPPEFGGRVYEKAVFKTVLDSGKYDRIRRSWADKAKLVPEADECLHEVESRLGLWDRATQVPSLLEVVNHHVWEWNGPVRLGSFERDVRVRREDDESEIPVVRINGDVWGELRSVPPLSRVRLKVVDAHSGTGRPARAAKEKAAARLTGNRLTLENGNLRVRVNKDAGGITSLVDLATGRDWVEKKGGIPFGQYRYDVYSRREIVSYLKSYAYDLESWFLDDFGKPGYPDRAHETFSGKLTRVEGKTGDGWARVRLQWGQDPRSVSELGNPARVRLDLVLFDGRPWLDMEYTLSGKEACPLLEAGHVVMPFSARTPRFAINKTGCVIDPDSDIARDANRLMFCCDRWVDVGDGEDGILLIPFDSPLFSIGAPAIERFDGCALTGPPVLYFNLFNTQWGTNFPQWIGGDLTFRFRIVPHRGDWRQARAWEHAASALQPPSCLPASRTRKSFLPLLTRPAHGLETVTLKRAEDDDGHILRLREPTGRGGKRTLSLSSSVLGASPRLFRCSLLEDELEEIPLRQSRDSLIAELVVRPFEILTLKLGTKR
jgi:hypothetical protein